MTKYERPRLIDLSDVEMGHGTCSDGADTSVDEVAVCVFGSRVYPDCRSGHFVITVCLVGSGLH